MEGAPDISTVAALIGDPARSKILLALMGGRALTATELSLEAEVAPSTTSAHLAKLRNAGLVRLLKSGRHRYFEIADEKVAHLIETLCGVALRDAESCDDRRRVITGPKDPAMRKARVCYDHLAGELAVDLYERCVEQQWLALGSGGIGLTVEGRRFFDTFGIDTAALEVARRATCRQCLDWSVRRYHLAGGLGAAILGSIYERGWATKDLLTRVVHFTPDGERALLAAFGVAKPPDAPDGA